MSKRKGLSWNSRYKRFFLDERTALIAAFMSILLLPVNYFFGIRSGGLDAPGVYDLSGSWPASIRRLISSWACKASYFWPGKG